MSSNLLGELVANNGTFIINTPDYEKIVNIDAIIVLEDTIFEAIYIEAINVKDDYLADSAVVKAGARITPINGLKFSGVYIESGSVELVLSA